MKILINALFLQNHLGGIGNYTLWLTKHLASQSQGFEFTLLVHKGISREFHNLPSNVKLKIFPSTNFFLRLFFFQLILPFRSNSFDLLHSIGNLGSIFSPLPQIITIHDTYEKTSPIRFHPVKRKLMSMVIYYSGKQARKIIAVSQNTARDIGKFYPHLEDKTEVIYSGIKFIPVSNPNFPKKENLLFIGTLEPGKRLDLLLKAFHQLVNIIPHNLIIVGKKNLEWVTRNKIADELLQKKKIKFTGYVSNQALKEYLQSSTCLILPSSYEGFGLPIIEAMSQGCPVIAANNSGMLEAGGSAAVYFKTDDVLDLKQKIQELTYDKTLQTSCAEKGLKHSKNFTWQKCAKEVLEKVYRTSFISPTVK